MNEPTIIEAIASLNLVLNTGATTATIDGQTTSWDPPSARLRIKELEAKLRVIRGRRNPRPIFGKFNLGGGCNCVPSQHGCGSSGCCGGGC